jgi:hypothetical protein
VDQRRNAAWVIATMVSLATATLTLGGCGGHGKSTLALEEIVRATGAANSARLTFVKRATGLSIRGTGEADLAANRYLFREKITDKGLHLVDKPVEALLVGPRVFSTGYGSARWCEMTDPSLSHGPFGLDPSTVLTSLRPPMTLQRIGTDTVDNVATTHYRILHSQTWNELWVDTSGRLRRIASHGNPGPTSSITIDFSDYGAPITPITTPTTFTPCIAG